MINEDEVVVSVSLDVFNFKDGWGFDSWITSGDDLPTTKVFKIDVDEAASAVDSNTLVQNHLRIINTVPAFNCGGLKSSLLFGGFSCILYGDLLLSL